MIMPYISIWSVERVEEIMWTLGEKSSKQSNQKVQRPLGQNLPDTLREQGSIYNIIRNTQLPGINEKGKKKTVFQASLILVPLSGLQ